MSKIVRLAVLVVVVLVGRSILQNQAARILSVAKAMSEDGQNVESLEKLRELDTWLGWTKAGAEGRLFQETVRKRVAEQTQKKESERALAESRAQWQADQRREEDHRRRMEAQQSRQQHEAQMRILGPSPAPRTR